MPSSMKAGWCNPSWRWCVSTVFPGKRPNSADGWSTRLEALGARISVDDAATQVGW